MAQGNQSLYEGGRQPSLLVFALLPLLILIFLWLEYQPLGSRWTYDWVPSLGINLTFNLDGLSFLFAALISGVGVLIQTYAWSYMKGTKSRFLFHLYLTLFMLAMLGVVLSDNILLLFVFWELTTITSYLLIGFNHENSKSRKNALQSLIVTGSGGLALLAGLIMLGQMAQSYELSEIVEKASGFQDHSLFMPSLVLILLGAFTKSAQFPFHFWLPNAMAAPTPVSAYLHSATMVKAGIYLLARVSPIYSGTEVWVVTLMLFGGVTALWCALVALKQTDLKLMLAYSTNVALGKLTLLLGLGTELAIAAAMLFIVAHSFYKASLFMVVGNIDKATGTRDIRILGGLKSLLVLSLVAAGIAALSKSGVPPMMGFLSKEYMYKAGLESGLWIAILLLLVNAIMVALALALVIKPFLQKPAERVVSKPVERDIGLWVPPILLAFASLLLPLYGLNWVNTHLISPSSLAISPAMTPELIKLWQGLNLPLLLSVITTVLGIVLYLAMAAFSKRFEAISFPDANKVFDALLEGMLAIAKWQTRLLQQKRLSLYVLGFFSVLGVLLLSQPLSVYNHLSLGLKQVALYEYGLAAILIGAALLCAISTYRLLSVAALGVVGFMTTLVFMLYSAPDVAKTLLLVETLMVIFVVLVLKHLPTLGSVPKHSLGRRAFHMVVAGVIGFSVTAILITITSTPLDTELADFFAENSVPGGHGRNVVNVILVDFRAIDTLGEVIVVVIAGLSAVSLLKSKKQKPSRIHSLIFATTSHIVAALMLVFSFYLLLRGHNAPGGGFIGALIAVIGLSLLMFAESPRYVRNRINHAPFSIAMFGVLLSLTAGALACV
ncbi:Na(+) H(+) antiporter subunit A [Vibrio ishigakensis]|uniref:Na(+) H(+) antiporter subunit A n=1 Tax=Vibrio ishigakensis TaxID=1481914 RepID=A0A0B8Q660_9VIBR|nr:Na(+) H(+) antiporter subunit A [Vibrio ishigakensis]